MEDDEWTLAVGTILLRTCHSCRRRNEYAGGVEQIRGAHGEREPRNGGKRAEERVNILDTSTCTAPLA